MKILVSVKQVPKGINVKFDENNNLIRENLKMEMNLQDKFALEMALELKDKLNASIDIITMGLPNTEEMLKEYLPYGIDNGYVVTDKLFSGADTLSTSYTLAQAIKHIGNYDLIICGTLSSDGATGQVGPQIAEHLGINLISSVKELNIEDEKIKATRENGKYLEKITSSMPALITVNQSSTPLRDMDTSKKRDISNSQIQFLTKDDFDVDTERTGLRGSKTIVSDSYQPEKPEKAIMIAEDSMDKSIDKLFDLLKEKNLTI